jgi:hypothetical protein
MCAREGPDALISAIIRKSPSPLRQGRSRRNKKGSGRPLEVGRLRLCAGGKEKDTIWEKFEYFTIQNKRESFKFVPY